MEKYKNTIIHSILTLLLCMFNLGWFAVAFYIGREVAQAEYRYITDHGGKRNDCPWYCGFLPESWTKKGMLDWLLPLCVVILFNFITRSL